MRKQQKVTLADDLFGFSPARINSKAKGNSNELVASKPLSRWTGYEFVRIPQSGGIRWRNTMNICGDLIVTDKDAEWYFTIETKHLKSLSMNSFGRKVCKIGNLWQQASRDADREGRLPMMMLRENGMPEGKFWLFFDARMQEQVFDHLGLLTNKHGAGEEYNLVCYNSEIIFAVPYKKFLEVLKRSDLWLKKFSL